MTWNLFNDWAKTKMSGTVAGVEKPLSGQVAIVTGASSGIGVSVAQILSRAGADVALAARREDRLQEVKAAIEMKGGVAIAVKCDVTSREQVAELVRQTEATLGPVDILVNNAGIMYRTMMKNVKQDEWEEQVDVNCKGVLNCIGAVLEGMVERGRGHIVNMSSVFGRRGCPGLAVYCGTKFFVEGLSQSMRQELAKTGVKVTSIQPGEAQTELNSHSTDAEARVHDRGQNMTILEPDDVAKAVMFAVNQPPYSSVNEILIQPCELP